MAQLYQALFLLISLFAVISGGSEAKQGPNLAATASTRTSSKEALDFIKSSCKTTTYKTLCIDTLLVYANKIQRSPLRLLDSAITVSLNQALSTKLFVAHLTNGHFQTLQDCAPVESYVENAECSVQELQEVVRCNTWTDCLFHVNNAEVCAISGESVVNTCSSTFSGRRVKISDAVRKSLGARFTKLHHEINNVKLLLKAFAKN